MFHNPIAASADPASSHIAAAAMNASGKRVVNAKKVYDLLAKRPGSTAVELYKAQGKKKTLTRHEVSRRLPDLLSTGCVRQGAQRKCKVNKTTMVTWHINGPFIPKPSGSTKAASAVLVLTAVLAGVAAVRATLKRGSNARRALLLIELAAWKGVPPQLDDVSELLEGKW